MKNLHTYAVVALLLCWTGQSFAQDLEPRRWTQMPIGLNFMGIGIGHIEGDIFFVLVAGFLTTIAVF